MLSPAPCTTRTPSALVKVLGVIVLVSSSAVGREITVYNACPFTGLSTVPCQELATNMETYVQFGMA
jgi:hypothetical protein